jgi:hypothetical protein
MSLFVNQIKTLITTLSQVKEPETFNMEVWYEPYISDTECGYAACICGHQSLAPISGLFSIEFQHSNNTLGQATQIASDLDVSCITETGDDVLAKSVYSGDSWERFRSARDSDEFTKEELEHPHLITNSSPLLAISFMQLVLTKLENRDD